MSSHPSPAAPHQTQSAPTWPAPRAHRTRKVAAVLLLGFALTACKESLYSNLSEQEANEVYATLARAGITADKRIVDEKSWGIAVDAGDIPGAMDALSRAGLPRERFANLGDLFKRDGIVPTPTEERVRFLYGISQELAHTLNEIDGVISSRVHIVMPENDPLSDRTRPSSASVFIKHRADTDLQALLPSIRSLVLRSVEGLTHDAVFVSLFPADVTLGQSGQSATVPLLGSSMLGIRVKREVAAWLDPLLMLGIVLAAGAGLWALLRNRERIDRRVGELRLRGLGPSRARAPDDVPRDDAVRAVRMPVAAARATTGAVNPQAGSGARTAVQKPAR